VVAGVLWGVHGRVPDVAMSAAVRVVQFTHWPFRRPVPTLGLDFGYGHLAELVQVAIFDDFGVM
jgi:hypothetical protein